MSPPQKANQYFMMRFCLLKFCMHKITKNLHITLVPVKEFATRVRFSVRKKLVCCSVGFIAFCKTSPIGLQKESFRTSKGVLSACKTNPFAQPCKWTFYCADIQRFFETICDCVDLPSSKAIRQINRPRPKKPNSKLSRAFGLSVSVTNAPQRLPNNRLISIRRVSVPSRTKNRTRATATQVAIQRRTRMAVCAQSCISIRAITRSEKPSSGSASWR